MRQEGCAVRSAIGAAHVSATINKTKQAPAAGEAKQDAAILAADALHVLQRYFGPPTTWTNPNMWSRIEWTRFMQITR